MIRTLIPVLLLAGTTAYAAPRDMAAARAAKAEAGLARDLAGLSPGRPQQCIRKLDSRSSRIYGDTILFKVSSGLVYRTETSGGCADREMDDTLVSRSPTSQFCAGDPAETYDIRAGLLTGTCTFGRFVPYRRHR